MKKNKNLTPSSNSSQKQSKIWNCSKCTYQNNDSSKSWSKVRPKCFMCGSLRVDSEDEKARATSSYIQIDC